MTDPNADLYGFIYEAENGERIQVTGPVSWSPQYVTVKIGDFETIKPAAVVRRHRQIVGDLQ